MNVRRATEADLDTLFELWREFEVEVPQPDGFEPETAEEQRLAFTRDLATGAVYLAEDDDGAVGLAQASAAEPGRWHLELVYVRPRGRRRGIATALLRECVREAGAHGCGCSPVGQRPDHRR
jgi:ribosomal protein S18 acetylase RimI-like enzyme